MKRNALPLLIFTLIICIVFAGAAQAKDLEMSRRSGELDIRIRIDRNPPIVGTANLDVSLRDATGRPVTDADVLVHYYMPPMPRMAPMSYKVEAKRRGESYGMTMNLIMEGPWYIVIRAQRSGKITTAKFNIDVK